MQCPLDGTQLVMTDRSGVEIDYCPKCRGVWLDRGELDKIIERSSPQSAPREGAHLRSSGQDHDHSRPYKKKRREGFLSELFDF
ncbi:zf-TFIIB domain-containing protein [Sulfitobacter sp. 15WGC]|uniref:TFIIB-type zinc ribbon-containing protein n=1 Tax=Sulfitobacter sp. 15WGC TaxID=2575437 RepID=UPI0010ADA127|nr:zf-TFIIB domain-containing protein [Sulfitobacter sp. 15WGC]TKA84394.1 hypothetical protein FCK22_16265 [Sulfitobacter sp. 15WGC]